MHKIDTIINTNSPTYKANLERMTTLVAELRQRIIFGDRRKQDDAEQALALQEVADILQHRRRAAIDRPDDQLELGFI